MKFSKVNVWRIPSGSSQRVRHNGETLWTPPSARYVSFGDSIAAGHAINSRWEIDYGTRSQYGNNGHTETVLVPGCYTDLIHRNLRTKYKTNANTTSFAKSGDRVDDVIRMLDHDKVQQALSRADYVTLCIGANDVLEPAMSHLADYIWYGDIDELNRIIDNNLAVLADDNNPNSYTALFNKLSAINPDAKYVFTTVYNPYKYLYIEGGRNGFFGPLLNLIPSMYVDVDKIIEDRFLGGKNLAYYDIRRWRWVSIELGFDLRDIIIEGLLLTLYFQTFYQMINLLSAWSEIYVTQLNTVLRDKLNAYKAVNPNFFLADAKAAFDTYPDRPVSADVHYNDLVNVEFTKGYDTAKMDWGALWRDRYGSNVTQYWLDLAWKHLSFHNAFPSTNVWDYVSFDLEGFGQDLITQVVEKVIVPNVDPHPEEQGHIVLKDVFSNFIN